MGRFCRKVWGQKFLPWAYICQSHDGLPLKSFGPTRYSCVYGWALSQPTAFGLQPLAHRAIATSEAPIAQLDRALPSEGKGRTFETCWSHQIIEKIDTCLPGFACGSLIVSPLSARHLKPSDEQPLCLPVTLGTSAHK